MNTSVVDKFHYIDCFSPLATTYKVMPVYKDHKSECNSPPILGIFRHLAEFQIIPIFSLDPPISKLISSPGSNSSCSVHSVSSPAPKLLRDLK